MVFQVAAQNATGELGDARDARHNFSLLALGYSISGFLGPLVAGFTIDHVGFASTFALLALRAARSRSSCSRAGRLALPGPPSGARARRRHGGVLELLAHRTLRRVFAVNVLLSMGWDLHTIFVPVYGARIGLSASADRPRPGVVRARRRSSCASRCAGSCAASTEHQVLTVALFIAGAVYLLFPFVAHARRR